MKRPCLVLAQPGPALTLLRGAITTRLRVLARNERAHEAHQEAPAGTRQLSRSSSASLSRLICRRRTTMRSCWLRILALALVCLCPAYAREQESGPFAKLGAQASRQWGGWQGSQQALSKAFQKDRDRLGKRFETELLKFVGRDVTKHYKTSLYLVGPQYLHGRKPLPHLALLLKHQAIAICEDPGIQVKLSEGHLVSLHVTAAVLAEQSGFHALAAHHKRSADNLVSADDSLGVGWWPAMYPKEHDTYKGIGIGPTATATVPHGRGVQGEGRQAPRRLTTSRMNRP